MSLLSAIAIPFFHAISTWVQQQTAVVVVFVCVFLSYLLYHWLPGQQVYTALMISAIAASVTFLYLNKSILSKLIPLTQHNFMSAAEQDVVSDLKAI